MNALTLGAALRIPCIMDTGYESDGKLLNNDVLHMQYVNKKISCQQIFERWRYAIATLVTT